MGMFEECKGWLSGYGNFTILATFQINSETAVDLCIMVFYSAASLGCLFVVLLRPSNI